MRRRQALGSVVVTAAVVVGTVAALGTSAEADSDVERPFRYRSTGTIENEPPGQCDLDQSETGELVLRCDQQFASTDEVATHLGRSTSTATGVLTLFIFRPSCTTPDGNPLGTQFESNTLRTIVAANGDALFTSTTVTGCGDGVGVAEPVGTYTVTGGTGRFAGASGGGGVSSSVLGESIDTAWTGTITY